MKLSIRLSNAFVSALMQVTIICLFAFGVLAQTANWSPEITLATLNGDVGVAGLFQHIVRGHSRNNALDDLDRQ